MVRSVTNSVGAVLALASRQKDNNESRDRKEYKASEAAVKKVRQMTQGAHELTAQNRARTRSSEPCWGARAQSKLASRAPLHSNGYHRRPTRRCPERVRSQCKLLQNSGNVHMGEI
eukprot:383788-Pleurochrysis_carterae.AAC.1